MKLNDFLVLVINLDRAPQRLEKMKLQLDALGLRWERLPAADGQRLNMNDPGLLDPRAFGRRHGKTALTGELGCYVSHVQAFKRLLASDAPYAVVLEDDAVLHADLPEVLAALHRHADGWDMVKLSGVHRGHPLRLQALTDTYQLAVMLSRFTGASAYVVNRRAAQVYAQGLLPMCVPYDHEFDRGWHWHLKTRAVWPSPCAHDQVVPSTIEDSSSARLKFPWYQRWPAFGWRALNEINRVIYGIKTWLTKNK